MKYIVKLIIISLFFVLAPTSLAMTKNFTVKERAGVARINEHVNYSIIFSEADNITSVNNLKIISHEAVFKILARFGDLNDTTNLIKSVLVDFQDDFNAGETKNYTITNTGSGNFIGANIASEDNNYVYINTGVANFRLSKSKGSLFDYVKVGGTELVSSGASNGLVLDVDRTIYSSSNAVPTSVRIIDNNSLYSSIIVEGTFEDSTNNKLYPQDTALGVSPDSPIRFSYLYYFYKGKSSVKVVQTLKNENIFIARTNYSDHTRTENLWLYSLRSDITTTLGGSKTVKYSGYSDSYTSGNYSLKQNEKNHNGFDSKAYQWEYEIEKNGSNIVSGSKYEKGMSVNNTTGGVAINPRWFWQNYPAELAVADNKLSYVFLPERDSNFSGMTPPDGYTRVDTYAWYDAQQKYRFLPGRWKSWHVVYDFFEGVDEQEDELASVQKPLVIKQSAEDIANSDFFGSMFGDFTAPVINYGDGTTFNEAVDFYNKSYKSTFEDTYLNTLYNQSFPTQKENRNGTILRWTKDNDSSTHYSYGSWYGWNRFGGSPRQWGYGYNSQHYDFAHLALMNWIRYDNWEAFDMCQEFSEHLLDMLILKDPDATFEELSNYNRQYDTHGSQSYERDALNDYFEDLTLTDAENSSVGSDHVWTKPIFLNYLFSGDDRYKTVMQYNLDHVKRISTKTKPSGYFIEQRNVTRMMSTALDYYQVQGDQESLDNAWLIWRKLIDNIWIDINEEEGFFSDRIDGTNRTTTGYRFHNGYGSASVQYMTRLYKILKERNDVERIAEMDSYFLKWGTWVRDRLFKAFENTPEDGLTPGTYYSNGTLYKPYSSWSDSVAPVIESSDVEYQWLGLIGGQTLSKGLKNNNSALGYSSLFYAIYVATGDADWLDLGRTVFKDRFLYGVDDGYGNSNYPYSAVPASWDNYHTSISSNPGSSWKIGIVLNRPEYNMEIEYKLSQGWLPIQTTTRANVNGLDGVNTIDAMLTLRNSLGLDMTKTSWQVSAITGDVDCDGISNSIDAVLLLRYSLGLDMTDTEWCE